MLQVVRIFHSLWWFGLAGIKGGDKKPGRSLLTCQVWFQDSSGGEIQRAVADINLA
jgi:hypothetical protein